MLMKRDDRQPPKVPSPLTAHALLRWFERAKGVPVAALRKHLERRAGHALSDLTILNDLHRSGDVDIALASAEILTPGFINAVHLVTALQGVYVRQGKIRFPVRDGIVITALPAQFVPTNARGTM